MITRSFKYLAFFTLLSVGAVAAPVQIQIDCAKPTVELNPLESRLCKRV